jgi:hypothetical protein
MKMTRKAILEARTLFQSAMNGNLRARADLQEALSTSDFPILLNASYAFELQGEYAGIAPIWQQFSRRLKVKNFRPQKLVDIMGGRGALDLIKEASEYPARSADESEREFSVDKYGARFPLTWEMIKNDELNAFENFPQRLATAAREMEDRLALYPLFNSARTGLSTFADARDVTGAGTALSMTSLNTAFAAISSRIDEDDDRPVLMPEPILMVPPSLENVANNIINTTEIRNGSNATADGSVRRINGNGLTHTPKVVVNPWLPIVGRSVPNINTMWYLLPPPSEDVKPALGTAFMVGEDTPDLRVKSEAGNRVGGGAIAPEEGSFDDDTVQYRVRHVIGSTSLYDDAVYIGVGA